MSAQQGTEASIKPTDPLARFIYSSSHFSRERNRVKHNAFMPDGDRKTSVFRTKDLNEAETWAIGDGVAQQRAQTLHARGDILVADVSKVNLRVVPSEPPPRHANIQDWPEEKSAQKLKAIDLADAAILVPKPSPAT
jgi:hypothetical protein